MGDCRLRIQVSKVLLSKESDGSIDEDDFVTLVKVCSSDTTIREIVEASIVDNHYGLSILHHLLQNQACLWDCTQYPPTDITDWPLNQFTERQGLRSKTLYDCGWMPSGMLQVLPRGKSPQLSKADAYEDSQYNRPLDTTDIGAAKVQLATTTATGQPLPPPSAVLGSVTKRFADDDGDTDTAAAIAERFENRRQKEERNKERCRKLDAGIRKLEEQSSSKNQKVSDQVQRMLIKSRATGRSSLQVQDRIHLRCIVDNDGHIMKEEFWYFSRQDTVGRIIDSLAPNKQAELLVRTSSRDEYRRLSVALRLHQAVDKGYLSEFDKVVIRIYDSTEDDATPGIDEEANTAISDTPKGQATEASPCNASFADQDSGAFFFDQRLSDAVQSLDTKMTKKKPSNASIKVRQIQLKSRAKGDAKRIKIEDRFFLELVQIEDGVATAAPVFGSRSESLERLLRNSTMNLAACEVLVSKSNDSFLKITDLASSLQELEDGQVVENYGRLVLRSLK